MEKRIDAAAQRAGASRAADERRAFDYAFEKCTDEENAAVCDFLLRHHAGHAGAPTDEELAAVKVVGQLVREYEALPPGHPERLQPRGLGSLNVPR